MSFVAQGYDFVIFTDLNIMFEMFNEITTHEKVPIIRLFLISFFSFLFHNQRNSKNSFKIFYKILQTYIYIYILLPIEGSC